MILTGPEIKDKIELGIIDVARGGSKVNFIHIEPYSPELVGPNSVDLRLGNKLLVYSDVAGISHVRPCDQAVSPKHGGILDMQRENPTTELTIPSSGIILYPGVLYLGSTMESIGSNLFVPIVEGRSSVGRLGIHVHVTAGFCEIGFKGEITLEIHVIHPVRVYPETPICQAYFLTPKGKIELYNGRYGDQVGPVASRIHLSESNT